MMTNAEGREAFIKACEAAEHLAHVRLSANTPILIGGVMHRVVYDPRLDEMTLITEGEWRQRLERARALKAAEEARVVRVNLEEGQHACVVAGRSVWRIGYDETVDDYVAIRTDRADR